MRINRIIFSCVVIASVLTFATSYYARAALVLDQPFDSYGNISWENEEAHLDNFAIALQHDPDLIGYIIVYAGRRACIGEAQGHAHRAKEYVVKSRGIQENRIRWIDGGHREELTVILQPIPRDAPELTASPTIKPSHVQVIKNCKLKPYKRKKRGS